MSSTVNVAVLQCITHGMEHIICFAKIIDVYRMFSVSITWNNILLSGNIFYKNLYKHNYHNTDSYTVYNITRCEFYVIFRNGFDLHSKIFICIMPIVLNLNQLNSAMLYKLWSVMTLSISFSNSSEDTVVKFFEMKLDKNYNFRVSI